MPRRGAVGCGGRRGARRGRRRHAACGASWRTESRPAPRRDEIHATRAQQRASVGRCDGSRRRASSPRQRRRQAPWMFEPRGGAGDGEEGGRGGDPHAEWPSVRIAGAGPPAQPKGSRRSTPRVRGRSTRRAPLRRPRAVDGPARRGSRRCSGRPGAVSRGARSVRTLLSAPGVRRQGVEVDVGVGANATGAWRLASTRSRRDWAARKLGSIESAWSRCSRAWRGRRRRMRRGRRPPAPAELSDVVVDPRAVGLQDGFQLFLLARCHLRAVELDVEPRRPTRQDSESQARHEWVCLRARRSLRRPAMACASTSRLSRGSALALGRDSQASNVIHPPTAPPNLRTRVRRRFFETQIERPAIAPVRLNVPAGVVTACQGPGRSSMPPSRSMTSVASTARNSSSDVG